MAGLFTLHLNPDGSTRAEFGPLTAPQAHRLALKLNPEESALACALGLILVREGTTPAALDTLTCDKLRDAFRPDLETVTAHPKPAPRKKARRALLKRLETVLDSLENQTARKSHGSAAMLPFPIFSPFGPFREMPLAWVALETARRLVEVRRSLPTKGEVREAIERQYPQAIHFKETAWREAWKAAGLKTLPKSKPWSC